MSIDTLIKREFPLSDEVVFLNHAGVGPWPARTARAVSEFAEENVRFGAAHYSDWLAREALLHQQIQRLLNTPSANDVALLKNTSEAVSVVAFGLDWQDGDNVVGTQEEFPSNRIPWEAQERHGVQYRAVDISGADPEGALMAACNGNTRIMAVSSVQYGTGRRLKLNALGAFCRERGILFCVDAIQSLGACAMDVQAAKVDFLMADAHKWLLSPEGTAIFYCRPELREHVVLTQYGWHMLRDLGNFEMKEWRPADSARRFEAGSPNTTGIYALSATLSLLEEIGMAEVERRVMDNTAYLMERLRGIPGMHLVTPEAPDRHAGIVTFRVEGRDPAELCRALMARQIICAHRGGGVRFSPHFYTPRDKLDRAIQVLESSL